MFTRRAMCLGRQATNRFHSLRRNVL